MSDREELEAEIEAIEQAWLFSEDAGDTAGRRRHLATALISSGHTKGNGEPVAYLRDAQPDAEDEALFVCAKGDSGCFPVYAEPVPDKGNGELVEAAGMLADAVFEGLPVKCKAMTDLAETVRKALSDIEASPATNGGRDDG